MNPGAFNHKIRVQAKTDSVSTRGQIGASWSTAWSAWAKVSPLRGRERLENRQAVPEMSHNVQTWFREGYTPDKRLVVLHKASTLGAAISSTTATSITIASATALPGSGEYWLMIDSEIMRVTGGQGTTTLTVRRGEKETTAATHNDGSTITQVQILNIQDVVNRDSSNTTVELFCAEVV